MASHPNLGIGVGLRAAHYREIFSSPKQIDWFEIISENFLYPTLRSEQNLEKVLESYPVVLHGVTLSIGSADPLDFDYLKKLKKLADKTDAPWVSDHLSWGKLKGAHYHDLLPLPCKKEYIDYVAERARIVQDYLERPFALENLSTYASFCEDEMPEWEFYQAIIDKAGIWMMLDVNNIYVSSRNHGFSAQDYYQNLSLERVLQIHLAGHTDYDSYCLDTHDERVCDAVWEIYAEVCQRIGAVSTLLEWDDHFLSFEDTCKEAMKAKAFQKRFQEAPL